MDAEEIARVYGRCKGAPVRSESGFLGEAYRTTLRPLSNGTVLLVAVAVEVSGVESRVSRAAELLERMLVSGRVSGRDPSSGAPARVGLGTDER